MLLGTRQYFYLYLSRSSHDKSVCMKNLLSQPQGVEGTNARQPKSRHTGGAFQDFVGVHLAFVTGSPKSTFHLVTEGQRNSVQYLLLALG